MNREIGVNADGCEMIVVDEVLNALRGNIREEKQEQEQGQGDEKLNENENEARCAARILQSYRQRSFSISVHYFILHYIILY